MKLYALLFLFATATVLPAAEPKEKGQLIYLRDYGTDDIGFLVVPDQQPQAGVVILTDGHGLTKEVKQQAEMVAGHGYLVLVVDLYNGNVSDSAQQAARMESDLMEKAVQSSIKTGINFFQSSPRFKTEHVLAVALGGVSRHLAVFAGKKNSGLEAVIFCEPTGILTRQDLLAVHCAKLFLVADGSPLPAALGAAKIEEQPGVLELKSEAVAAGSLPRLTETRWKQVEDFYSRVQESLKKESLIKKLFD